MKNTFPKVAVYFFPFLFPPFPCPLFKPCLEDKVGHFLVGIVILLLCCSFWVPQKYWSIFSSSERVMCYLHFINQEWRLVVEAQVQECLLIWGPSSMIWFLGLMHFAWSRHIPCCDFNGVVSAQEVCNLGLSAWNWRPKIERILIWWPDDSRFSVNCFPSST